jgi:hypothetical protein
MGQVFSFGLALNMSAQSLVNHCKNFYSQSFWNNFSTPGGIGPYNCNSLNQIDYAKPTTAGELFGDYICERGPEHVYFHGTDVLTHKLARSLALDSVRKKFYGNGSVYLPRYEEKFGDPGSYINEWKDLAVDPEFPLVHLMGSFWVSVSSTVGDRIRIQVDNRTDLASGTHFIGRFPPEGQEATPYSLQDYIRDNPDEANKSAAWIVNTHPEIVSILQPLRRSQTGPGFGGGNFEQTFTWTERDLGCWAALPWPIYIYWPGLEIGNDTSIASVP